MNLLPNKKLYATLHFKSGKEFVLGPLESISWDAKAQNLTWKMLEGNENPILTIILSELSHIVTKRVWL